jgi:hypothetical protein
VQVSRRGAVLTRAGDWFEIVAEHEVDQRTIEMTLRAHALEGVAWWIRSTAGEAIANLPPGIEAKVATIAAEVLEKHRAAKSS